MLNYIKADFYRLDTRISAWIWTLVCLILPPVMIIAAGGQYEVEKIMAVIPVAVYLIFILVALMLTESVFGEDRCLGLYKNDTTSGISRTQLFLSKYLTSVLCAALLWLLCSVFCAFALTKVAGTHKIGQCFGAMFSLQSVWWLLLSLMYAAMFQAIRVLVNKTSMMILCCAVISGLFSQAMNLVQKIFPALATFTSAANMADMNAFQIILWILLPLVGISVILAVGCMLFKKSEF